MRILFVCTGNTCRSPMAEMYFNFRANQERFDTYADSAGIFAIDGIKISENAKKVLHYYGIPLNSSFQSKSIKPIDIKDSKFIFTMENFQAQFLKNQFKPYKEKIFVLPQFVGINDEILDPFNDSVNAYFKIFEKIRKYINLLLERREVLNETS